MGKKIIPEQIILKCDWCQNVSKIDDSEAEYDNYFSSLIIDGYINDYGAYRETFNYWFCQKCSDKIKKYIIKKICK